MTCLATIVGLFLSSDPDRPLFSTKSSVYNNGFPTNQQFCSTSLNPWVYKLIPLTRPINYIVGDPRITQVIEEHKDEILLNPSGGG